MGKLTKSDICTRCNEDIRHGVNIICHKCEIAVQLKTFTPRQLKTFFLQTIPKRFIDAKDTDFNAALYADAVQSEEGVFVYGSVGVGKSHLMAAMAKRWLLDGLIVRRVNYERLLLEIRSTFADPNRTELQVIEPYIIADRLIIEDVGTTVSNGQRESDFSYRTFQVLLNERDEAMKPTYITSNKTLEQIKESFDDRVESRIARGTVINLTGEDRRIKDK